MHQVGPSRAGGVAEAQARCAISQNSFDANESVNVKQSQQRGHICDPKNFISKRPFKVCYC